MGVIAPTMTGCTLLHGNSRGQGGLKTYLCTFSVPAYTSSDTITISDVGATIATRTGNGKTNTLYCAMPVEPGIDTNGQACYLNGASVAAMTISSDTLTGELCDSTIGNILTSSTAAQGCMLAITVTES